MAVVAHIRDQSPVRAPARPADSTPTLDKSLAQRKGRLAAAPMSGRCVADERACARGSPLSLSFGSDRSVNETKARALVVAIRPLGKTAQRSVAGRSQSVRTAPTSPDCSSGNIQADATVTPSPASTAARTPSAAVTFNRPFRPTDV